MGSEFAQADAPWVGDEEPGPAVDRLPDPQEGNRQLLPGVRAEPEDGPGMVEVFQAGAGADHAAPAEHAVVEGGVEGPEVQVRGPDGLPEQDGGGVEVLVRGMRPPDEAHGFPAVLGDGVPQRPGDGVQGLPPCDRLERVGLDPARVTATDERCGEAVGVGDVAVPVAPLVAVPEGVDGVVGQGLGPQHLRAPPLDRQGAPDGAERARRGRGEQVPRAGQEPVRLGGQGPDGADLDRVAGEVGVERLRRAPVDLGDRAPVDQLDLLVSRDLPAEPHAAPAENATLPVEQHQLRQRDRLAEVALLLPVAAPPGPEAQGLVLQGALPAAVADGAVERVVDEEKLQHRALRLDGRLGIGAHHHAVGHGSGAGGEQLS